MKRRSHARVIFLALLVQCMTTACTASHQPLAPEVPTAEPDRQGRNVAVVIGISNYADMTPLLSAANDARSMAATLSRMGFEVDLILNEQATRDGLRTYLGDRLPARLDYNDRVIIFFSGHGQTVGHAHQQTGYLMPVEARRSEPVGSGISMREVSDWLRVYPSRQVMLIADACYSGFALPSGGEGGPDPVRVIMVAGTSEQQAFELEDHGVFTHFVMQGLSGDADGDGDGTVTAHELFAFAQGRVKRAVAARFKANQTPQMQATGTDQFTFPVAQERDQTEPGPIVDVQYARYFPWYAYAAAGALPIAFLSASAVFAITGNATYEDAERLCQSHNGCSPDAMALRGQARSSTTMADVTAAIGFALGGLWAATYSWWDRPKWREITPEIVTDGRDAAGVRLNARF